jgi:type I restriction enzyme, S subunit
VTPATLFPARRLKYAATINDEALSESTDPDFELAYIDIGNVDSHGRVHDIVNYRFDDAPSRARRIVRDGDVIISTVRTYLQAIAPVEDPPDNLIVSTGFAVVRSSNLLDQRFCKYVIRANSFLWEVESRSTGVSYPAINASDLGDIKVSLPEVGAQRLIADYLDRETARIDALIAEKERMLALLEEKRAALISRIVTRGIDPKAPLKPSGQAWLGKIPAHWKVQPIKYLAVVGNGSTPSVEKADYWDDEGYPWLNSSVVNVSPVTDASRFVTETALRECHLPKIEPPAVLVGITGQGKTRGMAAVLGIEATINQHIAFIKPRSHELDTEYLCFLLGHAYAFLRSDSDGAGSTKGAITCEQLANMKISVPPTSEQVDICTRIRQSLDVSKPLRAEIQRTLDLLTERRSALITAAVTGQIPVEEMTE